MPLPKWRVTVPGAPAGADDIHLAFRGAFLQNPQPTAQQPSPHRPTWDPNDPNVIQGKWTPACAGGENWVGTVHKNGKPSLRSGYWTKAGVEIGKIDLDGVEIQEIETSRAEDLLALVPHISDLGSPRLWRQIGFVAAGVAVAAFAISLVTSNHREESE